MKYYDFKQEIVDKTSSLLIDGDKFIENINDYSPPNNLIYNIMGVIPVKRSKVIERQRLGNNGTFTNIEPEKCGKIFIAQLVDIPFVWSELLASNEAKDQAWYKRNKHYQFMNHKLEKDGIIYIQDYLLDRIISSINSID